MNSTKTIKRFRRSKDLWCEFDEKYPLKFNPDFGGSIILSEVEYSDDETRVTLAQGRTTMVYVDQSMLYPCLKEWHGTIIEEFTGVL